MEEALLKYWPLLLAAAGALLAWGEMKASFKAINVKLESLKSDIERLETKQDKYNHLQERTIRNEESAKSAHKRIGELEVRLNAKK